MSRRAVVIVGGGFGGLSCAKALDGKPLDVLLVDRRNYHLFTPLLYQVATALLNMADIARPFRAIFRGSRNIRFRQAHVTALDFDRRRLRTSAGDELAYDYLVLATGSENNYFGNPALAEATLGMKTLGEAQALRNRVLACLERATQTADEAERRRWLTFVVVGGGPTGVEYAGALKELLQIVLGRDYPELRPEDGRIVLAEGLDRLLAAFPEELGRYAQRVLEKRGVEVELGAMVDRADENGVLFAGGKRIETRTVVWSAGVRPTDPTGGQALDRSKAGRLAVDERLRLGGRDEVFAIGDVAAAQWRGAELPMLSAPAMQEGRYAARAIVAAATGRPQPGPFRYRDKGTMATIGRNAAVALLLGLKLKGFVAWVAWLTVHLWYTVGFRNRLAVFVWWGWNYIRKDRPIRLIQHAELDPVTAQLLDELELTGKGKL